MKKLMLAVMVLFIAGCASTGNPNSYASSYHNEEFTAR